MYCLQKCLGLHVQIKTFGVKGGERKGLIFYFAAFQCCKDKTEVVVREGGTYLALAQK